MINIDNKIKEQLNAIIETMNILQKHWYEAGAIIDDEGSMMAIALSPAQG
jgi:hypothetical protein